MLMLWLINFFLNNVKNKNIIWYITLPYTSDTQQFPQYPERLLCPERNSKWMNSSLWPVHFRPWINPAISPERPREGKGENERKTERQIEMFCVITWVCRTTAHIRAVPLGLSRTKLSPPVRATLMDFRISRGPFLFQFLMLCVSVRAHGW